MGVQIFLLQTHSITCICVPRLLQNVKLRAISKDHLNISRDQSCSLKSLCKFKKKKQELDS